MGYFSNGTEGDMYEEKYCARCIHGTDNDCPIWDLHLLWNYDAVGENKNETKEFVLNLFIPREGLYNGDCVMFHATEREPERTEEQAVQELVEWYAQGGINISALANKALANKALANKALAKKERGG